MRNALYQTRLSLTETVHGVGSAELWLVIELIAPQRDGKRHGMAHDTAEARRRGEITRASLCQSEKPVLKIGQCEGDGEWKSHKSSRVSFHMS